jgi:hypothetical protein
MGRGLVLKVGRLEIEFAKNVPDIIIKFSLEQLK